MLVPVLQTAISRASFKLVGRSKDVSQSSFLQVYLVIKTLVTDFPNCLYSQHECLNQFDFTSSERYSYKSSERRVQK